MKPFFLFLGAMVFVQTCLLLYAISKINDIYQLNHTLLYSTSVLKSNNNNYKNDDEDNERNEDDNNKNYKNKNNIISNNVISINLFEISRFIDQRCESIRRGWLDIQYVNEKDVQIKQIEKGKLDNVNLNPFSSFPSSTHLKNGNDKSIVKNFPDIHVSPRFRGLEFRCYSQNSEDGILVALFNTIGVTNKKVVEVCSGVGWENNAAFLITHFGFKGILMDGSEENAKRARAFFSSHPNTKTNPPVFINTFITAENINELIMENGFQGEIDLFSLDMDGVDYWIWDALNVVQPRVVVVEIQEVWGWDQFKTRPYRSNHVSMSIPEMGASIMAFVHLAKQKGYRLVGCIELGFNAFFVRSDIGIETMGGGDYNPEGCFYHWSDNWKKVIQERRQAAAQFDWVDPRYSSRQDSIKLAKKGLQD